MAILQYRDYSPETLVKVYDIKTGANEDNLSSDDLVLIGYCFFDSPSSMFVETYDPFNIVTKSEFNDADFFDYKSGMDNFKHYNEKI